MKTINAFIFGFLGLMLAMLTPVCVLAVVFGTGQANRLPTPGSAEFRVMIVLMPAFMVFSAWHYVFRYLIPWFARLRILKVGDKKNTQQWLGWVEVSLRRAKRDCEALEAYRNDLAGQIGPTNDGSPRR
jgi:hypothetical protein